MAGLDRRLDMLGHLRDGGRLENTRGRDLELHDLAQSAENAYRQKGVATQCKEIIVDTDLFDLKNRCRNAGQHLLERCPWGDRRSREGGVGRETEFSRQADTLHFAGRTFWNFRDDEHLARHLEVGDAPMGEPANLLGVAAACGRNTTAAATSSPRVACGTAKVTASATAS